MSDNRSTRLRQRVQDMLGDPNGDGKALSKAVYNALNRAQTKACEKANAYETAGAIALVAGTEKYAYPDGMISEISIAHGSHAPLAGTNIFQIGTVDQKQEVEINATDTAFSWDIPFTREYEDLNGDTVPLYRFTVESARVDGSWADETYTIVAKSLTGMTLRASSDATIIRFRAEE